MKRAKKGQKFKFVFADINKKQLPEMNVETLTATIVDKMSEVGKWQRKFLLHLFRLWLSLRGRYNFLNMARYGNLNEATYRANFGQKLDSFADADFPRKVVSVVGGQVDLIQNVAVWADCCAFDARSAEVDADHFSVFVKGWFVGEA